MGRACLVCSHDKRHVIEATLVSGASQHAVAARFGLSHDCVGRHYRQHLDAAQRAAILVQQSPDDIDLDKVRADESAGLLANVSRQRMRLQGISEQALGDGDTKAAISAESAITSNLTLTAKLVGQLIQVHQVNHNHVLTSEDYLRVRGAIVAALRPYREAAIAVGRALAALESEGAEAITAAAGKRKAEPVLIDVTPNRPEPPAPPGPPPPPPTAPAVPPAPPY
jgi:hypothetical protein